MKSKIVLVIAMLLLVSMVLISSSFIFTATAEYEEIVKEESKQNEKEETPPKEEEPPTDEPEDPGEGGDPIEPAPVVKPMLDGYFSASAEKSYSGYRWVVTDQYQAWQPMDGISGGSTTLLAYFGDGLWSVENKNSGWLSDPLVTVYSDYTSPEIPDSYVNLYFYYQVCRNGVWEDCFYPMDGSLFTVYIQEVNAYGEMNMFEANKATKMIGFAHKFLLSFSKKTYVAVSLSGELDPSIDFVNFYVSSELYLGGSVF